MSDASQLRELFQSSELDSIVWRGNVDDFADGADYVDVVVSSQKPTILADVRKVGLTWWPNGPVARGIQNYAAGTSVTFARVPVKRGGQLVFASSSSFGMGDMQARVDVVPAGRGSGVEDQRRGQGGSSPIDELFKNAGLVIGGAVVLLLIVAYIEAKK